VVRTHKVTNRERETLGRSQKDIRRT
jgi:hypothetical protein